MEEIADLLPEHSHILHAEILLAEGAFDKAITVCEKCEPWPIPYMSDTDGMLGYNIPPRKDALARAFLAKGDLQSARDIYERLARFDPRSKSRQLIHPDAHRALAQVYREIGDEPTARQQMDKYRAIKDGVRP
jgi:tetratricopeptide (TPR) repeat protein